MGKCHLVTLPRPTFQSPFLAWALRTSLLLKVEFSFLWPKGSREDKPLLRKRAVLRTSALIPAPPEGKGKDTQVTTVVTPELTHCSVLEPGFSSTFKELQGPALEVLQQTANEKLQEESWWPQDERK